MIDYLSIEPISPLRIVFVHMYVSQAGHIVFVALLSQVLFFPRVNTY